MGNGALATTEQKSGGIMDMNGGAGEMAMRLADMENKLTVVREFFKRQMIKDFDYGVIPGTDKPTLYKAGAEKLLTLYGLTYITKDKKRDSDGFSDHLIAQITVQILHAGVVLAEGVGEASTYESKYRYRWVFENDLPRDADKSTLISKTFESKKTGKEYTRYRLDNPDLADQWNTVMKMAKKRALVDGVLSATRTSGIFSQAEGDMDAWMEGDEIPKTERMQKQKTAPTAADEKSQGFNPSTSGGMITIAQKNKILYDADKKHIKAEDIEAIVKSTKQKPIAELTKSEASAVIDWLGKISESDLQDLVIDIAMDGDK